MDGANALTRAWAGLVVVSAVAVIASACAPSRGRGDAGPAPVAPAAAANREDFAGLVRPRRPPRRHAVRRVGQVPGRRPQGRPSFGPPTVKSSSRRVTA